MNWHEDSIKKVLESVRNVLSETGAGSESSDTKIYQVFKSYAEDIYDDIEMSFPEIYFYNPFSCLKQELIRNDLMFSAEKSYVNFTLKLCIEFIESASAYKDFLYIHKKYKDYVLYDLGLIGYTRGYFYDKALFDRLLQILEFTPEETWKKICADRYDEQEIKLYPIKAQEKGTLTKIIQNQSDEKTVIPVVMASDNNYVIPMMVTIASLLQSAAENTIFQFYLLVSGDFSAVNTEKITDLCSKSENCTVKFVNMHSAYQDAYIHKGLHITIATYYRLQIASLFPYLDKCVYLDVDVVAKKDISAFWKTDISNYYLAGVRAAGYYNSEGGIEYHRKRLDLSAFDTYINAGVLLMNLKKIRKDNLEKRFAELTKNNWESQDQDILNAACYGKIKLVEMRYNAMTKYPLDEDTAYEHLACLKRAYPRDEWESGRRSPVIIHYADKLKPWKASGVIYAKEWWEVVNRMPGKLAFDIYASYQNSLLEDAERIRKTLNAYEPVYKEVKESGRFEYERIQKFKYEYENANLKEKIHKLDKQIKVTQENNIKLKVEADKLIDKQSKKIEELEKKLSEQAKKLSDQSKKLNEIRSSFSYRFGFAVTMPFRKIYRMLRQIIRH